MLQVDRRITGWGYRIRGTQVVLKRPRQAPPAALGIGPGRADVIARGVDQQSSERIGRHAVGCLAVNDDADLLRRRQLRGLLVELHAAEGTVERLEVIIQA